MPEIWEEKKGVTREYIHGCGQRDWCLQLHSLSRLQLSGFDPMTFGNVCVDALAAFGPGPQDVLPGLFPLVTWMVGPSAPSSVSCIFPGGAEHHSFRVAGMVNGTGWQSSAQWVPLALGKEGQR